MKTLKQYADDLRATASLLIETADALAILDEQRAQAIMAALGLEVRMPQPVRIAKKQPPAKRIVTPEDKANIRREYESIPPDRRTKEMRTALALKWQVSPQQFNLLTLSRENINRRVQAAKAAKAEKRVASHLTLR